MTIIDAAAQKLCYMFSPNTASEECSMTPSTERVSAKIYPFPSTVAGIRLPQKPALPDAGKRPDFVYDPCWYHNEAIRDAEKPTQD